MVLKSWKFAYLADLCDFVNKYNISRDQIQVIVVIEIILCFTGIKNV